MREQPEIVKGETLEERHRRCLRLLQSEIMEKRQKEQHISFLRSEIQMIEKEMARRSEHGAEENE